jgi:transposase-like protein
MGTYHLGKRPVQALFSDLFGLQISLGAVVGCQKQASRALEDPYTEACKSARRRKVKYADETSWREEGRWVWLWTIATEKIVVFRIQPRRSAEAARSFLGRAVAYLVSDRAGAYEWWDMLFR